MSTTTRSPTLRNGVIYALLIGWTAAILILGAVNWNQSWSGVCILASLSFVVPIGLGAWFGSSLGALYGTLLLTAAAVLGAGVWLGDATLWGCGALGMIIVGATAPLAWSGTAWNAAPAPPQAPSPAHLASTEQLLARIHENSMLSDNAKRVLFRDRELGLLRQAIEQDIAHGDYNAGLTLCDELANLFGQREEAEALRARILQAGQAQMDASMQHALAQFERHVAARDWAAAHREAASMKRLFPSHHLVQNIDERILIARDEYKRELEAQFLQAAGGPDVIAAMGLLKQLDRYLTREEASRLGGVAQTVVTRHREHLSQHFKQAVSDRRWAQAAQIGELIIDEYPNAKMADEVRGMIDALRTRATQAAVTAHE